jgi:hypothetical protein
VKLEMRFLEKMNFCKKIFKKPLILTALSICFFMTSQITAQPDFQLEDVNNTDVLTINITKIDISDTALNLTWEIRNDSSRDGWILAGWGKYNSRFGTGMSAGMSISEDGSTITISARSNVQEKSVSSTPSSIEPVYAKFVRLYPGESQTESFFARIPVYLSPFTEHAKRGEQGVQNATRLAIELGYYSRNLPERILKTLKPAENILHKETMNYHITPDGFSGLNECLISRDEELLVSEGFRELKGESEKTLSTVIENLNIPYKEKIYHPSRLHPPDLTPCVKVEFQYKPSTLEYFFPYASQQSLLSTDEMEYLQSDKTIVLKDKQEIKTIANDILRTRTANTIIGGISVRYRGYVDVVCYYNGKPSWSFPIYDDNVVLIEGEEFWGSKGFPSLKILTPKIQAIDLRMRCATNLKNLWYHLRFYNQAEAIRKNDPSIRSQTLYPTPNEWCNDILCPYPALGGFATVSINAALLVCPSAREGKNHYAMNPYCKPDSPADMVFLFETKGGWNQHGGPELFTFDNHNPKGGCVLLNDGTVKFIRTTEELNQLRWR